MGERVVKLSRSYAVHGRTFDSVKLREPNLADYFAIGDPVEIHSGSDGEGRFAVEHGDRISSYLDRLAVAGDPGRECLNGLDLPDSMVIKEEIIRFFTDAHRRRVKLMSSSGEPDSQQQASSN